MKRLSTLPENHSIHTKIAQDILRAVASIDYGSVEIVIHDNKVVQIELREKIRIHQREYECNVAKS